MKEPKQDAKVIANETRELLEDLKTVIPEDFEPFVFSHLPEEGLDVYCEIAKCMGYAYEKAPNQEEKDLIAYGFAKEAVVFNKINQEFSEDEKFYAYSQFRYEMDKPKGVVPLPSDVYGYITEHR